MKQLKVDICAIGGGSGGMAVAGRATRMGASAALIEKAKMGGDCLNYGCVPSKALLAAGHVAETVRRSRLFGVDVPEMAVNSTQVYRHVAGAMAAIAPNDSPERFEKMGVKVIQAAGRFIGPREVEAGEYRIQAKHFVIATGSSPAVPAINGLDSVSYHTNETIFDAGVLPEHLIIIGGGPTGVEMAQAHRNLGAKVTLLEMASILPKDDPELVEVLRNCLSAQGIDIQEGVTVTKVENRANGIAVLFEKAEIQTRVEGSHILVATGRVANVDGLDLEKAGIAYTSKRIQADARLRTTNKNVFAVGDVVGDFQFAHMAGHHADIVLRNTLFRWPAKVELRAVPWVTFTDPELSQVGMNEYQAKKQLGNIRVLRWSFTGNDRAHTQRQTEGLVKVITTPGGRVVGAGIVGPCAGELIYIWVLAVTGSMNIRAVSDMIAPYPTFGYVNKYAADSFRSPVLFGDRVKKIVRLLNRIP